jgi:hypothetical protein
MTEWSVTYIRKQGNTWKKGKDKVTLWFQATAEFGDLVVHFKERCLVWILLLSQKTYFNVKEKLHLYKGAPIMISRIDHQIRFGYYENNVWSLRE